MKYEGEDMEDQLRLAGLSSPAKADPGAGERLLAALERRIEASGPAVLPKGVNVDEYPEQLALMDLGHGVPEPHGQCEITGTCQPRGDGLADAWLVSGCQQMRRLLEVERPAVAFLRESEDTYLVAVQDWVRPALLAQPSSAAEYSALHRIRARLNGKDCAPDRRRRLAAGADFVAVYTSGTGAESYSSQYAVGYLPAPTKESIATTLKTIVASASPSGRTGAAPALVRYLRRLSSISVFVTYMNLEDPRAQTPCVTSRARALATRSASSCSHNAPQLVLVYGAMGDGGDISQAMMCTSAVVRDQLAPALVERCEQCSADREGRATGTVDETDPERGFGRITQDDSEEVVFFSALTEEGYESFAEGQRVAYTVDGTGMATRIRVITSNLSSLER